MFKNTMLIITPALLLPVILVFPHAVNAAEGQDIEFRVPRDGTGSTYNYEAGDQKGATTQLINTAKAAIQHARSLGIDTNTYNKMLEDAQLAFSQNNFLIAQLHGEKALRQAEAAVNEHYINKSSQLLTMVEQVPGNKLSSEQSNTLARIRAAIRNGEGRWAYKRAQRLLAELAEQNHIKL